MSFSFFGVLQFVVAGFAVCPPASRRFNVFQANRAVRLRIDLIDDDEKFPGFPPQRSTRATDVATMLEIANPRFQKWCGLMPSYGLLRS